MAKSKATKMKEISMATKNEVLDRQHNRSITGVYLTPYNVTFHHVIERGSGSGVGLAFNIVALTFDEHRAYHDKQPIIVNGRKRYTWMEFEILMKNYLKIHYPGWTEEACSIHKYWEVKDYWNAIGIERER